MARPQTATMGNQATRQRPHADIGRSFAQPLVTVALALAMIFATTPGGVAAQPPGAGEIVTVERSEYAPFYPSEPGELVTVDAFRIDATPVTNGEFLSFVRENPRWQRGNVPALFAERDYLSRWEGPLEPGVRLDEPVTFVSWFAARAYCTSQGGRLPYEREWELVARADETRVDATDDPEFFDRVLAFYSRPNQGLRPVGAAPPNVWGIYDLHGLMWEWVEDFNASLVSSDNRQSNDPQRSRFCGGAALGAEDTREYATFMRFAYRSSLEPAFAVRNLGFRCAYDIQE